MTCISLVLELKKGIKALSLINICVAIGLMTYVFLASNTTFILNSTVENIGNYLASFVPLSFDTYAFTLLPTQIGSMVGHSFTGRGGLLSLHQLDCLLLEFHVVEQYESSW